MGKVSKAVKPVNTTEKQPKVKKLLNNPGVIKTTAKLNLKEARVVPLKKILNNKNDILVEDVKPLKGKKNLSKPVAESKPVKSNKNVLKTIDENSVKPKPKSKPDVKVEQISMMKTLKRKSKSEKSVKLPVPKKTGSSPKVLVKKQITKKIVKETPIKKTEEVVKKDDTEVEKKTPKQKPDKTPAITLDKSQVIQGVSAILELAKIQAQSKKTLFDGEQQPIFLQVSCIKVPKVPTRQLRIVLPNTLVTDTDDVVLFVGDLKKGRAQDFEPTINHYKDILEEHGCKQIKDVIPLTQVKTEFDQHELKRKLLSSYDYFLTDGKIAGHLSHLLGKLFTRKRKLPTSIKMDKKDLKTEIDNALKKTSMQLHSRGNNHMVQVAHTCMEKQQILNNVLHVCKALSRFYPGGWVNIRSLILKTSSSLPVPIYITLKSKNKVKVPVVVPTRPKAHKIVSGELSTAPGNTRVIVKPDGTVEIEEKEGKKKVDASAVQKSKANTDKSATKKSKQNKKKTDSPGAVKENLPSKKTDTTGVLKENVAPKKTDANGVVKEKLRPTKNNEPGAAILKRKAEDSKNNAKTKNKKKKAKQFEDSDDEIEEAEQAYLNEWQQESNTTEKPSTQTDGKTKQETQIKKKSKIIKKKKTIIKKK